jgi:hypothetical protein
MRLLRVHRQPARLPCGVDVTEASGQRVAATFPASRIELVYAPPGGWSPGPHDAAVLVPGAKPDSWTFTVS